MESNSLANCTLDELIKVYEELNNFVNSLSKELESLIEGEENA